MSSSALLGVGPTVMLGCSGAGQVWSISGMKVLHLANVNSEFPPHNYIMTGVSLLQGDSIIPLLLQSIFQQQPMGARAVC